MPNLRKEAAASDSVPLGHLLKVSQGARMTYTYAVMNVSPACFEEIKQKLIAAQYQHALHNDGKTLDMHGIALEVEPEQERCGVLYKTFDNSMRPCLRDKDHEGGHNPFSNTGLVEQK
jgi:hypothetical protein